MTTAGDTNLPDQCFIIAIAIQIEVIESEIFGNSTAYGADGAVKTAHSRQDYICSCFAEQVDGYYGVEVFAAEYQGWYHC